MELTITSLSIVLATIFGILILEMIKSHKLRLIIKESERKTKIYLANIKNRDDKIYEQSSRAEEATGLLNLASISLRNQKRIIKDLENHIQDGKQNI